jgi:hypothetical protein
VQPIEFEVSYIPKKVYARYRRYAGWLRKPGDTIVQLLSFLFWAGFSVWHLAWRESEWVISLYGVGALMHGTALCVRLLQQRLLWGNACQRWRYTFTGTAVEAFSGGGVRQIWEYRALAYAREAKDAFYLATNETSGQAMVIPKEALAPEQCAALAGILAENMDAKKFTRWREPGKA